MKRIIKLNMRLTAIILIILQFKIDIGQSYNSNNGQAHFGGQATKQHNHHQSKGHGNSYGRWAHQSGRGCFWTGCMSKLHRHYCPASTFVHEVNPCPSPELHVDVMCCLSRPQKVTQPKIDYTTYPPPTTATTTTTQTPPPTTTTRTTTTTTVKTTSTTPPTTTTKPPTTTTTTTTTTTETPTTTTTQTPPTTTTGTPPTTTTEAPNTPPDSYEYIDITPSAQRKKKSVA